MQENPSKTAFLRHVVFDNKIQVWYTKTDIEQIESKVSGRLRQK